jgi:hypothetical protein
MSHETTEMMRYAPFAESRVEDGADALRAAMDARGYLFFRALVLPRTSWRCDGTS